MFDAQSSPRIFALPLGVDFSKEFVAGLLARLDGQPPEALAKVVIYVNTRRSARGLEALLSHEGARLLPDIRVITDLARDMTIPLPRPIPPLRRKLIVARLVASFLEQQPDVAPKSAVFDLADKLGELLDAFQGEGLAMDALADIDVGNQSDHWERARQFLEILGDYWNNHRPEDAPDSEERQRMIASAYAENWRTNPPAHPVIVAGSTGSRGATAIFMKAVASLPQGAVVLPGYDYDTPDTVWSVMAADHPQFGFGKLQETLGFSPDVPTWTTTKSATPDRNKIVSLALRPAPVTDQWLSESPALSPVLANACQNLSLIEAPSQRSEAEAIAIRLRKAAEDGQKAALVTPDRMLARRVSSVLKRWDITADDSAGRPLPLTPPGIFLRRLAGLAGAPLTPQTLLAILKHPLCGGKENRKSHLDFTRKMEIEVLRGGAPFIDWDVLNTWAKAVDPEAVGWINGIKENLSPLLTAPTQLPLAEWVAMHKTAGEMLAKGLDDNGTGPLWEKDAGKTALNAVLALDKEAAFGGVIAPEQYRALFQSTITGEDVRDEAYLPHPGVAILGTLEARVQSAELVILGGLNEGIWPSSPNPDPWMSRDMRRQIGLPMPERQIGLSAHDFQQAMAAKHVVISRAIRDGDSPTVASRWLIRLLNMLAGIGENGTSALDDMRARGNELLALSTAMNHPPADVPPARRPSPSPPKAQRPTQLSVTRIETLIRDPYAIYAEKILKLRALEPPGKDPDARERGTALHKVLELFVERTKVGLPDNAEEVFVDVAREVLEEQVPWPSTRRLWLARLRKISGWFIEREHLRRGRGHPLANEVTGQRKTKSPVVDFTLTAKADRLDLLPNGSIAIYDYKSGGLPSQKKAKVFAVQLPLEGAIAQVGGFDKLAAAKVAHLELIGLGSGGTEIALGFSEEEINEIWLKMEGLVSAFASPTMGYTARLRPEHITYASDFDHLSRFGEWQDGDEFEAEPVK